MVKVGDKVVVVSAEPDDNCSVGDVLVVNELRHPCGFWAVGESGFETYVKTEDMIGASTVIVRPYTKSEAEKRGAKFGTMGVVKATGERCVYICDSFIITGNWDIYVEGAINHSHLHPSEIRLDHEPEYKEIPFRNATDSQRLNIENIYGTGGKRPIEALKTAGGYYVYTFSENTGPTMVNSNGGSGIEIRIPA